MHGTIMEDLNLVKGKLLGMLNDPETSNLRKREIAIALTNIETAMLWIWGREATGVIGLAEEEPTS